MDKPALQHFETFLIVAKTGSFTAAAKQLGISKAAVSHTIRLLEESLQVGLFIRTTRRVSLTDEGSLLLSQCERLKCELDTTRDLVAGFIEAPSGKLRISCNPYLVEARFLSVLQDYIEKYPQVEIDVLAEERMPDMQREQIDIVFGINWPAPEDIVARPIGKTRYVLCASPAYLKKNGTPKKLKDLEKHRYIPHLGRTATTKIITLKSTIPLNLITPLQSNNAYFMKKSAELGLGIVQLHDYMVEDELRSGKLVEVLQAELQPSILLFIYYQKHRFVQPKIRQFVNLLLPS